MFIGMYDFVEIYNVKQENNSISVVVRYECIANCVHESEACLSERRVLM